MTTSGSPLGQNDPATSDLAPPDPGPASHSVSTFWRYGFPAAMVVLVLLIPVLLLAGRDVVLHSTEGSVDEQIKDSAAPGWQALTEPTPTLLLLETGPNGGLASVTVLSLASDQAGAVILVPADTSPGAGQLPLSRTVMTDKEAVPSAVSSILGAGLVEVTQMPSSAWADLVAPVAPLTVDIADDLYTVAADGVRTVQFARGPLSLQAKDVAAFLAARNPDESDVSRMERHKKFWQAWLAKVGTRSEDDAVPGEKASGLGRFVRALAVDRVETMTLPVLKVPLPMTTEVAYVPSVDQVRSMVAKLIPFPIGGTAGERVRIRLLDGTGTLDHGLAAAPVLVQANGQIDVIGNAPAFGLAKTQLTYRDESRRADIDRLQQALGVGEVVKATDSGGSADVTVTLGQDYVQQGKRDVPAGTTTGTGNG